MSDSLWPHGLQHARPPCPSPTPRVYSNSCPLSQWCHPTVSSSAIPFSSHLQSFQHQGLFNESVLLLENSFDTTGQSTVLKIMLYILEMPLTGRKSMLFTYFQLTISLGSQIIWILSPREVVLAPPPHQGPRKKIHLQYWPCKAKSKCCLKRETYGFFFPKKYIPPYLVTSSSIIPQL